MGAIELGDHGFGSLWVVRVVRVFCGREVGVLETMGQGYGFASGPERWEMELVFGFLMCGYAGEWV